MSVLVIFGMKYADGNVRWLLHMLPRVSHVEYAPRALYNVAASLCVCLPDFQIF